MPSLAADPMWNQSDREPGGACPKGQKERIPGQRHDLNKCTLQAFDEELEPSVFASPLSSEQPVESTARHPREVPWERAVTLVGFPVRLPRSLPDGARPTRCLVSPDDPPGWVGHSWTFDPGGRYRLSIRQGPDLAERAGLQNGRLVARDGVEFHVEEYRGEGFRTENVAFELEGTWFEISSDLPLETILDVALSIGRGA